MKDIEDLLSEQRFFQDLTDPDRALLAGCGKNLQFKKGTYLAREGESANLFFLIRHGRVAVEINSPGMGGLVLETLSEGEVVGWSWLFPPHRWTFDVRAAEDCRVIGLDGQCLRRKAEANPELGYRLMRRFAQVMAERLRAARIQLMDLYGQKQGSGSVWFGAKTKKRKLSKASSKSASSSKVSPKRKKARKKARAGK